jgi:hypothetical protein
VKLPVTAVLVVCRATISGDCASSYYYACFTAYSRSVYYSKPVSSGVCQVYSFYCSLRGWRVTFRGGYRGVCPEVLQKASHRARVQRYSALLFVCKTSAMSHSFCNIQSIRVFYVSSLFITFASLCDAMLLASVSLDISNKSNYYIATSSSRDGATSQRYSQMSE